MSARHTIQVKRIYDAPSDDDGSRVLVDRLWPRGVSKEGAALDAWIRDVAPGDELRRWYGHDPDRTSEFEARYRVELGGSDRADALDQLAELAEDGPLTLLTATKDIERSHVVVLADHLRSG